MRIIRGRETELQSQKRSDTFTGGVWGDAVVQATDGVLVNDVFFEPRARTHWHRHQRGQLLVVKAGQGWVRSRDGSGDAIRAGDTVWIPPGEEHWHGADSSSYLLHLAVSLGETEWLDPVTDDEYGR
jgi:quercetin dioxygenase-like cupin family protein